jgi:ribosome-binding protein aMBF1 (putative translation factor)
MIDENARRMLKWFDDPLTRHIRGLVNDPRTRLLIDPTIRRAIEQFNTPEFREARRIAEVAQRVQEAIKTGGGWRQPERREPPKPPHPGIEVRRLRKARGWTQEQLAEKSGISLRVISDLERLKRVTKPSTLRELMQALEKPDR